MIAPLASLQFQHDETTRAIALGIVVALTVAAIGGWFIGRQTLKPLTRMANQAREINARDPTQRLGSTGQR